MSTELAPIERRERALLVPTESVAGYIAESLSESTRRAYRAALRDFRAWCEAAGVGALPASPETVAAYLASLADRGRKVATLTQRAAAIRWAHEAAGLETPTSAKLVRSTMAGIRRRLGVGPARKAPATVERLAVLVAHAPNDLKGMRDRALLLFGFASAMRRSELAALNLADLEETDRGLLVTLRRSKTDQEGAGHQRGIPFGQSELCPVRALRAWLEAAEVDNAGAVFRSVDRHGRVGRRLSPRAIGDLVKSYARQAGLDPAQFSGHSLRAGFITSASERGATSERIADHTGHRSVQTVRGYVRRVSAFDGHAGDGLL